MNRRLILVIAAALVLGVAILLAVLDSTHKTYAMKFLEAIQILGLMEMLLNGTFISTRYFKITLISLGSLCIGALMTMVHSTTADVIILLSIVGILVSYLIHFLRKKPKTFPDIMKLSTLLFLFPLPILFFRPISDETKNVVLLLGRIVFAITFVQCILRGERRMVWYKANQ